jgi:hypothetical protein
MKIITFAASIALLTLVVLGGLRLIRTSNSLWGYEFPLEGLVVRYEGDVAFEQVGKQDRRMLFDLGFPKALHQVHAQVRHLVIYQDCHYFFTTDGRVIVMTPSADGGTPRFVETRHWTGAPHDFRDYRKELLPST